MNLEGVGTMKYLIVIDMQNDFISGSLGTKEAVRIVPAVIEKIRGFSGGVSVPCPAPVFERDP